MSGDNKGGFLSFKKMITVPLVRSTYFVVFMGINLCAFVLLLNQFFFHIKMIPEIGLLKRYPYLWPILFLALHLFWRLFCEGVVIVFRIYETLVSIESTMKGRGMTEEKIAEAIKPVTSPKAIRSRKDFKIWKASRLRMHPNKQGKEPNKGKSDNVS